MVWAALQCYYLNPTPVPKWGGRPVLLELEVRRAGAPAPFHAIPDPNMNPNYHRNHSPNANLNSIPHPNS